MPPKLPVLVTTRVKTYLDHAGSQLPAKSLVNSFAIDLNNNNTWNLERTQWI